MGVRDSLDIIQSEGWIVFPDSYFEEKKTLIYHPFASLTRGTEPQRTQRKAESFYSSLCPLWLCGESFLWIVLIFV